MELSEAFAYIDTLSLKDDYADFSVWSDTELLHVRMSTELSNIEEADRFMAELKKRGLTEQYQNMRKLKH